MKWVHYNHWVDGRRKIGVFDTQEEAVESVKNFLGHLDYPRGENTWASDDGDISVIKEVLDHEVSQIPDHS